MSGEVVPYRVWQQGPDGQVREIIVYQPPICPASPQQLYPQPHGGQHWHAQPCEPRYVEPYRPHPVQKKRRRKTRGLGWKTLALFVCSWIPVGMGWPGLTILAWGLIGVWLFREAMRGGA